MQPAARAATDILVDRLLAERVDGGWWVGELATSALSTATAVIALHLVADPGDGPLVAAGAEWLGVHQNADGGWGDTTASPSNISTTALCWSALALVGGDPEASGRAEGWLAAAAGSLQPAPLSAAIIARYGEDHTFSVPILTVLALAEKLGPDGWRRVPQLPFELAALPRRWFRWLGLPVVSYAIPALIAIGRVRHARRPTRNPLARVLRWMVGGRVLRVLTGVQPAGGGFLEATPLTSFVVMSLAAAGLGAHPVVREGAAFLRASVRPDGSWPIDTNLATWVTTLAVKGLGDRLPAPDREAVLEWLLAQQYTAEHPYTLAPPGGWAWTDLPGGVPDADDTAGALLALRALGDPAPRVIEAAAAGVRWLLDLQNRDGGIPTFCRGWGTLPFDRSGPDLTAHAIAAWAAWRDLLPALGQRIDAGTSRAVAYLEHVQRPDGAWLPLWFGNQSAARDENPTYGTACVLLGLTNSPAAARGVAWLLSAQNADGGWGGEAGCPSTVEETGRAVQALAAHAADEGAVARGRAWLAEAVAEGRTQPTPIGLYFARLWYHERLYPLVFAVGAFRP